MTCDDSTKGARQGGLAPSLPGHPQGQPVALGAKQDKAEAAGGRSEPTGVTRNKTGAHNKTGARPLARPGPLIPRLPLGYLRAIRLATWVLRGAWL